MRRKLVLAAAASSVVLLSATPAFAAWSSQGQGTAAASAGSLSTPTNVNHGATTTVAIPVTWTAPGGQQDGATYTATATASGHTTRLCTGLGSESGCTVGSLDAGTTYSISVVAGFGTNWVSGAASDSATTTATAAVTIGAISQNGNSGSGTIDGTATGGSPVSIMICKGTLTSCTGGSQVVTTTVPVSSGTWSYSYSNLKNSTQTVIATLGSASTNKTWST